jgi:hypothetical protein
VLDCLCVSSCFRYWLNGCDHRDLDRETGNAIQLAQEEIANHKKVEFGGKEMEVREVVSSNLRDVAKLVLYELESRNYSLPFLIGELRHDVDHLADTLSSGMSLKVRNWASEQLLESVRTK